MRKVENFDDMDLKAERKDTLSAIGIIQLFV